MPIRRKLKKPVRGCGAAAVGEGRDKLQTSNRGWAELRTAGKEGSYG